MYQPKPAKKSPNAGSNNFPIAMAWLLAEKTIIKLIMLKKATVKSANFLYKPSSADLYLFGSKLLIFDNSTNTNNPTTAMIPGPKKILSLPP